MCLIVVSFAVWNLWRIVVKTYTREELNLLLGMSEQEMDEQARIIEDETQPDGYTGVVIRGFPWETVKQRA